MKLARRRLFRRLAISLGAITLGLAGPAGQAVSSALAAPAWTLQGRVVDSAGNPVPNALVKLSALPSGAPSLSTTAAPTQYLAVVMAGTDGSYSIPAPTLSPAMLAQATANGGWLNLELDGETDTTTPTLTAAATEGTLDAFGSKAVAVLVAPASLASPTVGTIRSAGNPGVITIYSYTGIAQGVAGPTVSEIEHKLPCVTSGCVAQGAGITIDSQCGQNWHQINLENDWGVYSEFHTWDDETGWMQYGKTASTDIDFDLKYGDGGSWNADGSVHMGNSVGSKGGSGWIGTYQVQDYAAQYTVEEDESDSQCQGRNIYRTYTTQYTGGTEFFGYGDGSGDGPNGYHSVSASNQADYGNCNSESSTGAEDGGFTRSTNSDASFGGSLGISAFGGSVGLTLTTDYSTDHQDHWDFGCSYEQHSLFGYDGSPGNSATIIYASTEPF